MPLRNARHVRRDKRDAVDRQPHRIHPTAKCWMRLDSGQRVACEVAVVCQQSLQRVQHTLPRPQQRLSLRGVESGRGMSENWRRGWSWGVRGWEGQGVALGDRAGCWHSSQQQLGPQRHYRLQSVGMQVGAGVAGLPPCQPAAPAPTCSCAVVCSMKSRWPPGRSTRAASSRTRPTSRTEHST